MTLEELRILITAETSGLKKGLADVKRQMGDANRDVSRATSAISRTVKGLAVTLAAIGLGSAFRDATKDAMSYEAAIGQINRLMGNNAAAFQEWVNTTANGFGLARSEATRYGATYANLISGFTNGTTEVTKRTEDLIKTSAIVASATGRAIDDVMERIRSGLLGETDAIEDLGINVNVAMLEATNAFKQFANGRSWQQLNFQTQQTILYYAILEQAARKYGNELAQNTATRQAAFIAQLKDARLALGQAFLPIYNLILPALTQFATALANVMRFIAGFVQALFGSGATQTQKQTNAITSQTAAVSGLGDEYAKAGKKAKGAVASFDQVNLVGGTSGGSDPGGTSGAGGNVSGGLGDGVLGGMASSMAEISAKAQAAADKVKAAFATIRDFVRTAFGATTEFIRANSDIIVASLAGIGAALATAFLISRWASITSAVTTAIAAIRGAFVALGASIAGVSIPIVAAIAIVGALVGAFVYFYRTNETFRDTVNTILQKIGDIAQWLWQNVMMPFGQWLGSTFVAAWQAVRTATEWVWKNIFVPFGNFLRQFYNDVLKPLGTILSGVLAIAFKTVADIAKSFWQNVVVPLGKALKEMLGPAVEAISAIFNFLWKNVLQPLGNFVTVTMMPVWKALADIMLYLWKNVLQPLTTFVAGVFLNIFDSTFKTIGSLIGNIKDIFIGLMKFITGVFTGDWRKAWEGVRDVFKGIVDGLWTIIKFPLNLIIDGINALIGGLNKVKVDVPGWVEDLTGYTAFGINIPKIPKLATGTNYVASEGLAYLHEGEAVVPKKYNPAIGGGDTTEIVTLLGGILQALKTGRDVRVSFDKAGLMQSVVGDINDRSRRSGRPVLNV